MSLRFHGLIKYSVKVIYIFRRNYCSAKTVITDGDCEIKSNVNS